MDTTRPINDDLSRLTTIIRAAIAFFGLILIAVIAFAGWSANQTATDGERTLVQNALNQAVATVLDGQKSVAWWDEAVINTSAEKFNVEFADAEFGLFLGETYGHDELYIVDENDRPIYAYKEGGRADVSVYESRREAISSIVREARGERNALLRDRTEEFAQAQKNYKVLAGVLDVARWAGHIVSVDGKPSVIAVNTIVPNLDKDLLKGKPRLLVSIVHIDEEFIQKIAQSLLLPDLKLSPEAREGRGVVSEPFVGDDGIRAGYLSWTTRRPGHVLLTIILPLVACGVVATGFLSSHMFRRLRRASDELSEREARSRHASKHDALSGLPNRVHMVERLENWLVNSQHSQKKAIAAYIDIDRFKDINDTLGHESGDKLIRAVAQRLQSRLRAGDFLARFGGDEFAVLCPAPDAEAGQRLAKRIKTSFDEPFSIEGQSIRVTASVGLATAPDQGTTADEIMRHADIALYEAKNSGRDRAIAFTTEMAKQVETRRAIEVDLRAAIGREELRLQYQPIVSCRTGAIVGAEALLRWRHPVRGEMSPADFIPIAENSGLMPALGTWILERAMVEAKRWPSLEIAVNLSPVQFTHTDLVGLLKELTEKHDTKPDRFVLEVTEGVLLEATDHTKSVLEGVQAMGFKTALDDFGTGYSSLAYLCNFKFDKIKIDRSFVNNVASALTSRTIVQSVAALGRGLGMQIVAEGVETEYEAIMMAHFGCTELQGYHFSRPVDADKLTELMETFEPRQITVPAEPLPLVEDRSVLA